MELNKLMEFLCVAVFAVLSLAQGEEGFGNKY